MSDIVEMIPASEADLPLLSRMAVTAMSVHLIHRIIFPSNNYLDTSTAEAHLLEDLRQYMENPGARLFKACSKENTGEVVGYILFRFEDGEIDDALPAAHEEPTNAVTALSDPTLLEVAPKLPGRVNSRFLAAISSRLRPAYKKHMGGKPHVSEDLQHLTVWPHWQGKGVGSAMMHFAFRELELDSLPVWLATQTLGQAIYKKFGFEDVEVFDVDLSKYAPGNMEGYGLHRIVCMLRPPLGGKSMLH